MSSHKRRRQADKKDEQRRVRVGSSAAADDASERKESGDQTQPQSAAAAIRMQSHASEGESAAAAAAASPSSSSSSCLLPPRADLPECELCQMPLQAKEGGGAADGSTRLPRLLPCGHCYCTCCIDQMLQRSDNVVTCPQRCAFKHELHIDSATELPKNFALMKMMEEAAARSAQVELGAPPCSQCDPDQPRRAASIYCQGCKSYLCAEHEHQLHAVASFENHRRVSLAAKAQQQQAAAQQSRLLAQAATPIKDQLQRHCQQLKEFDAESQQLIQTMPQSQGSHTHQSGPQLAMAAASAAESMAANAAFNVLPLLSVTAAAEQQEYIGKQETFAIKLHQFADELDRNAKREKELLDAGNRDLISRQPQIAPLQAAVAALLQGSDLDIATRGGTMLQQCAEIMNELAAAKAQVQPRAAPSAEWLFGLQRLLLTSSILKPSHAADMCRFFNGISLDAHLLYRATRDGFAAKDLWQRCAGKGPTLTVVKVAGNGFICGAFTPSRWPADAATRKDFLADPSGRIFLFSLVNAHGRAVRLRLKDMQHRGVVHCGGHGPGWSVDLFIMCNKAANERDGCFIWPLSFVLDEESERAAGLPPISFAYDKTLMAGDDGQTQSAVGFAAAEIEVYRL